jgi:Tol biopolymer transport system component
LKSGRRELRLFAVVQRVILLLPVLLCAFVSDATGSSRSSEIASVTASSSRIAFLRGTGELVVVEADGRNRRTVVRLRPGFEIFAFSWEPSGRRIAFEATTPLHKERLYVIGTNGRGLRRLAQWVDWGSAVAWSPRGKTIAFDKHNDGSHQIWVINADGSGARRLTRPPSFSSPSWSPDGRRIALSGPGGIWVMKANGRNRRLIIRGNLEGGGPVWSPANKIAFYLGDDLWIANPDGSGRRIAIKDGPDSYEPGGIEFSPDGRSIGFSAYFSPGNSELMIGEVSTGKVRRLTDNNMGDGVPSWSPDGRSLAFTRYRPGSSGASEIYVINADGTGERNLTNSAADENSPAWAPR